MITHRYLLLTIGFIIATLLFYSCDERRVFEEYDHISAGGWEYKNPSRFELTLKDTAQQYDLYLKLRHHFNFEWRNVWVKVTTTYPDSTSQTSSVNLPLSEADGHWFARCTGDVCDLSILIQKNAIFPMSGKYHFQIQQDMRQNPLKQIIDVGLRIEKTPKEN